MCICNLFINKEWFLNILPSHASTSHDSVLVSSPSHAAPAPDGSGAVHVRVLEYVPAPQLALHSVQSPHSDHTAGGVRTKKGFMSIL